MPRVSPPTVAVSTKESFSQWLLDSRLGGKEGIQPSWSAGGKGKKRSEESQKRKARISAIPQEIALFPPKKSVLINHGLHHNHDDRTLP